MGVLTTLKLFPESREVDIFVIGKRESVHRMKLSDVTKTIPLICFDEDADIGTNIDGMFFGYGGRMGFRSLYPHYVTSSDAVVHVLDTTYLSQMLKFDQPLWKMALSGMKEDIVICIMAENLNQTGGLTTEELREKLPLKNRRHGIFSVKPAEKDSLIEAMSWLSKELQTQEHKIFSEKTAEKDSPIAAMSWQSKELQTPEDKQLKKKSKLSFITGIVSALKRKFNG